MSDGSRPIACSSQTVGPFFHFSLATNPALGNLIVDDVPGERIRLRVRVLDGDGIPVPDALIEIYQADASGRYAQPPFTGFGRLPTNEDGFCVFETIRPGAPQGQAPHINVCLLSRGLLRQLYTRIYFSGDSGQNSDAVLALVPADRRQTLMAVPGPDAAARSKDRAPQEDRAPQRDRAPHKPEGRASEALERPSPQSPVPSPDPKQEGRAKRALEGPSPQSPVPSPDPSLWDFVIRLQGDDETVFLDL
jgi:protocatechuate 3,4-dioxygenase alpha subunit